MLYGSRWRALVDVGVGPVITEYLNLHGTRVAQRMVYGGLLGAGVDYVGPGGLLFRAIAAVARPHGARFADEEITWALDLGLGYKLW